jgi:hypothetical protein
VVISPELVSEYQLQVSAKGEGEEQQRGEGEHDHHSVTSRLYAAQLHSVRLTPTKRAILLMQMSLCLVYSASVAMCYNLDLQ